MFVYTYSIDDGLGATILYRIQRSEIWITSTMPVRKTETSKKAIFFHRSGSRMKFVLCVLPAPWAGFDEVLSS